MLRVLKLDNELTEVSCYGDVSTHFSLIDLYKKGYKKEKKMIFEIDCNEGDVSFYTYEDREEWTRVEKGNIKGTELEQDSVKYLKQFIASLSEDDTVDLQEYQGRILIEGKIIVPEIKSTVNVIDL